MYTLTSQSENLSCATFGQMYFWASKFVLVHPKYLPSKVKMIVVEVIWYIAFGELCHVVIFFLSV